MGILLGLALAASCGLRVFLPLLGTCLAAQFHLITLQPDFEWLTGSTVTCCLIIAAAAEIFASFIHRYNTALVFIMLPPALAAGAIVSTAALPVGDPVLRWAVGIMGGGIAAGTFHLSMGASFFFPAKEPLTSFCLSAAKRNLLAIGATLLGLFLPLLAGILAITFVPWLFFKIIKQFYISTRNKAH